MVQICGADGILILDDAKSQCPLAARSVASQLVEPLHGVSMEALIALPSLAILIPGTLVITFKARCRQRYCLDPVQIMRLDLSIIFVE